ncbi:DNA replication licensing factor MCM3 [Enterocytozoon bieneusi H348]|nr:DNA replication licensing factor MCM3 [Enterocytozoon bieneusi H348]|eukprot:XP_001827983.1 DNA replication licensing factor MCM3 [Enterocytozoon bieneusi H348]
METSIAINRFKDYLNAKFESNYKSPDNRLIIDVNDMREFDKELTHFILSEPMKIIPIMQEITEDDINLKFGFMGSFGNNLVTPRLINSNFIGKMICCQGIITSISLVRPKIQKSVHYDEKTMLFYQKIYRDRTMITHLPPTTTSYPTINEGNILTFEYGLSSYCDFQTFILQEVPENSPPGQLPRSIKCIVSDDLCDTIKPGDRINAYGIYKSFVSDCYKEFPQKFQTVLIINNIIKIKNELIFNKTIDITKLTMVSESILKFKAVAPTIFGHEDIKKALALQMVGGNEIILKNGAKIRGDINILLIGDPSTAKSQLLRYVINFMPLTIATTGKGSTGVGLTAAIILDKETGEKKLEAGAMVLGDKGIVCIDEFDKMNESDRVAIHEAMEQQTITIAKAGIHTTLNARCSVLAAANPIFGTYNENLSPQDNVKLPESLLTRFDLVFITLDNKGIEIDKKISNHVLKIHCGIEDENEEFISQELFKNFILYAKQFKPKLSKAAASIISKEYSKIREHKNDKSLIVNITPRLLETIIRLSTACAKLRLSDIVLEEDALEAIHIINNNLIKKKIKRPICSKISTFHEDISSETQDMKNQLKKQQLFNASVIEKENLDAINNSSRDEILDLIWTWKEKNQDAEFCDINILSKISNVNCDAIKIVAEELAEQDIIMFDNDKIYFLD